MLLVIYFKADFTLQLIFEVYLYWHMTVSVSKGQLMEKSILHSSWVASALQVAKWTVM